MLDECDFRSLGSSKRFLTIDTLIMDGIAIKVMMKAVIQVKVIVSMKSFTSAEIKAIGHVKSINFY